MLFNTFLFANKKINLDTVCNLQEGQSRVVLWLDGVPYTNLWYIHPCSTALVSESWFSI